MPRVVRFHTLGGPEVLQFDDLDVGAPGVGQVRLRVRAIGINRSEVDFRAGTYVSDAVLPSRIGDEASGEVEAVGPGVTAFVPGDAVSTIPGFARHQYGVYGEVAIVPQEAVVKHPASLSWSEAASIWMQYLTAYGALVQTGGLSAGEAVIITAASSSVGLAAIQIANSVGATTIAVTRTDAKCDALLKAGAAHAVSTQSQDMVAEVMRATGRKGARVAFDAVCGPGVEALVAALADQGTVFLYGELSSEPTPFPLRAALIKSITFRAYTLYAMARDPALLERGKRFVIKGIESGHFKPIIARSFPFPQIADAHRYMESNRQVGKIVVTL